MSLIYILVPLALIVVGAALVAFIWAARSGQFDDLDTPGLRMLHDDADETPRPPASTPPRVPARGSGRRPGRP